MKSAYIILTIIALTACMVTTPIRWASPFDFALTIQDNFSKQRFELTLISKTTTPLCLSKESWPDMAGLPLGFDGAYLITNNGRRELLSTGSAYCPGGCGYARVNPDQALHGVIPYAAFGDVAAIQIESSRSLVFTVYPFVCTH